MAEVLIVDDTAVDRTRAAGLLEETGEIQVRFAENGKVALEQLELMLPDLVVTDMQMPEMDGLELVTRIRTRYPEVPVVLMTALGSDAIAIEALERGAASYVPKSHLHERLRQTVEDVLSIARAHESMAALVKCQTYAELHYDLENDPALFDILVEMLQQQVSGMRLTDQTGLFRIGVALREALHNAAFHGNLQLSPEDVEGAREQLLQGGQDLVSQRRRQTPYCDRRVHVRSVVTRDEARFVIRDDGSGFDYAGILSSIDPKSTGTLVADRGRGFVLMLSFMDEVSFNDAGNEVTMIKHRDLGPG
jgi:CheY-like chemotaxis protein